MARVTACGGRSDCFEQCSEDLSASVSGGGFEDLRQMAFVFAMMEAIDYRGSMHCYPLLRSISDLGRVMGLESNAVMRWLFAVERCESSAVQR